MPTVSRQQIIASSAVNAGTTPVSGLPPIEFEEPTPPLEECDVALGYYFRAWDQVEAALANTFQKLLGAHPTAAYIVIASGIGQQGLREITLALAAQRLSAAECKILEGLLDRVRKATTKRNRLTHGVWMIHITVNKDAPNTAEWKRSYRPTNPALFSKMHGAKPDQKVRDDHIFPVQRIREIADQARALSRDIQQLNERMKLAPFVDPQPISAGQGTK